MEMCNILGCVKYHVSEAFYMAMDPGIYGGAKRRNKMPG